VSGRPPRESMTSGVIDRGCPGREAVGTGDPALAALHASLAALPGGGGAAGDAGGIAVPLRLRHPAGELAFISTGTTFETAVDITVEELAIEAFFPADDQTARALCSLSG